MSLAKGTLLGPYEIRGLLGAGGMGEVYRAHDIRLGRDVALKVLPPEIAGNVSRRARFEQEARAIAALNHPNIIAVHDVGAADGIAYFVTELVEGETLRAMVGRGALPVHRALDIAIQIAEGLMAAHRCDIVHRDLKPDNVMVARDGIVKILDFGVAKRDTARASEGEEAATQTQTGTVIGTAAYMSPEQVRGEKVDARSDVWAFGVVFYEMVTGQRPFRGDHTAIVMHLILHDSPEPLTSVRPEIPPAFEHIVNRALAKARQDRYSSMAELASDLTSYRETLTGGQSGVDLRRIAREAKRPRYAIPAVLILLAVCGLAGWSLRRSAQVKWARERAIPEINRLIEAEQYSAAFTLASESERYIPGDTALTGLWPRMSNTISIKTEPPGAEIFYKDYTTAESAWELLGQSPIESIRLPRGFFRWKVKKQGFAETERASGPVDFTFRLDEEANVPSGMVRVNGQSSFSLAIPGFQDLRPTSLADYWIDRYEVTNKAFKEFVDAGGYQKREFWKHPFVKDGRALTWDEAMTAFCDSTNRSGPATWEMGEFPRGQGEYPVSGVSWYEAAAYAEFAGKSLPTMYHWSNAADTTQAFRIVPLSNFGSQGLARVGSMAGLSRWGLYDMAGNVKEWCWNESEGHKRYILGGAWNEPVYMFTDKDAQAPFTRSAMFGFRCMKEISAEKTSKSAWEPVMNPQRDYSKEKPAPDNVFQAYRSLYAYDKTPLKAVIESVDDSNESWTRQRITLDAAYGNERLIVYLFLPKKSKAPFQTVLFFPGTSGLYMRSSNDLLRIDAIDFIVKSGRAVVYPIYKSTYERGDELHSDYPNTSAAYRDHVVMWSKDMGRSMDYIETRAECDREKIAYLGYSWGGALGAIMPAVEKRFKAVVLTLGGFYFQRALPEADQINFAPRVSAPVLMLNGRYDFFFPVETSQKLLFQLLGAPKEHKRQVIYDTGHSIPRTEVIKETLAWLDRYLGPLK
jgi:dienelactone hydrolase